MNGHYSMESQDQAWLARYRAGDVEALGEMMDHYRRPLLGFILKMSADRTEAEDIFQDVWLRAIRRLHTFRRGRILSWLFRIAHNLVIDRARKRGPAPPLTEWAAASGEAWTERVVATGAGPAAAAGHRELKARIDAAVGQLPVEQRAVFLMRVEGDLPFKEIARIQRTSINTALARMQYALTKLREWLADDYQLLARG